MPEFTLVRGAIALFGLALLAYWTQRRARGVGDDPVLRSSTNSETGYAGVIISGFHAVLLVALVVSIALWREIQTTPALGLVPLGIVLAHYYAEKQERT